MLLSGNTWDNKIYNSNLSAFFKYAYRSCNMEWNPICEMYNDRTLKLVVCTYAHVHAACVGSSLALWKMFDGCGRTLWPPEGLCFNARTLSNCCWDKWVCYDLFASTFSSCMHIWYSSVTWMSTLQITLLMTSSWKTVDQPLNRIWCHIAFTVQVKITSTSLKDFIVYMDNVQASMPSNLCCEVLMSAL